MQARAPAPRRDRDHLVDAGMQTRRAAHKASSTTQDKRASGMCRRASVTAGMWWMTSPSDEVLMNRISAMIGLKQWYRSLSMPPAHGIAGRRFVIPRQYHTAPLTRNLRAPGISASRARHHDHPRYRRRRLYRQPHGPCARRRGRAGRRARQPLDRLRLGGRQGACPWCSATPATSRWSASLIAEHGVDRRSSISPASIVVPDSVADPLGYYRNNTANSRALIECAVKGGVQHFIFSSTAAVYGNPDDGTGRRGRSDRARCRPTAPRS